MGSTDDPSKGNEFGGEEITGVGGDPIENIDRRTKKTATDAKHTLSTLSVVREELRDRDDRHEREHKRLHTSIAAVDKRLSDGLAAVRLQVGQLSEQMTEMRVEQATVKGALEGANGKLDILVEDIQAQKRAVEHRERITIETQAVVQRTAIEDHADSKKTRRARSLKILTIIGGAVGTGGLITALITALLGRC